MEKFAIYSFYLFSFEIRINFETNPDNDRVSKMCTKFWSFEKTLLCFQWRGFHWRGLHQKRLLICQGVLVGKERERRRESTDSGRLFKKSPKIRR